MIQLTISDLDLIERLASARARDDFWVYRCFMNPKMKKGWWNREVAQKPQAFYERMVAGEKPKEVIEAPPQHGKSSAIVDFMSWVSGKNPDLRTIFASFSDRLGVRANLRLQRIYDGRKHKLVFPDFRIAPPNSIGVGQRNREMIEYLGYDGYFRNTTIRGPVTGESLDLGVVDDPIKGRADANSLTVRDSTWDWMTDDFLTRFSEDGALLIILTRWSVDDPVGRLREIDPSVVVHSYPAIATKDEKYRKKGEALFPELKSLEFLNERKTVLADSSFEALYQQNPYLPSGGMFPIVKFQRFIGVPPKSEIRRSVRYWDKAGTKDGDGAETAGTLMHILHDGRFVIEHVAHGRWAALEREQHIRMHTETDGYRVKVKVEQEPGSGGKESAEATVRNLSGYTVETDRPTGDKAVRAEPYAAQVQNGNVWLCEGEWHRSFLEQHEHFPFGKLKDMVDASSGAFNDIAVGGYDMEALAS